MCTYPSKYDGDKNDDEAVVIKYIPISKLCFMNPAHAMEELFLSCI